MGRIEASYHQADAFTKQALTSGMACFFARRRLFLETSVAPVACFSWSSLLRATDSIFPGMLPWDASVLCILYVPVLFRIPWDTCFSKRSLLVLAEASFVAPETKSVGAV